VSAKGEILYHPANAYAEQTWDGFSWPGFFFGIFLLAAKQLWVQFIIATLIVIVTSGFGNGKHLRRQNPALATTAGTRVLGRPSPTTEDLP